MATGVIYEVFKNAHKGSAKSVFSRADHSYLVEREQQVVAEALTEMQVMLCRRELLLLQTRVGCCVGLSPMEHLEL